MSIGYSKEDQLNRSGGLHAKELEKYKDRSMKWMKEKAKQKCHEYVRERDRQGDVFFDMGSSKWVKIKKEKGHSNYHAGHYYPAGEYPMLKYDEVNVNGESLRSNYFSGDHLIHYRDNLIKKWGRAEFNRLQMVASFNKRVPKKWTKIELAEIIKYYTKKLKDLRDASNHSVQETGSKEGQESS